MSPVAGTTRDVIECTLDVAGMKVLVADTAGLRESDDPIEGEGVRRALQWASGADLHILVVDGAGEEPDPVGLDETTERILVANKADLGRASWVPPDAAWVSLKTGAGVEALLDRVEDRVRSLAADAEGSGQITRARHRAGVTEARDGLVEARTLLGSGAAVELVAEETRRAVAALGKVTGAVGVEDVLEVIFREFCIGK